MFRAQRAIVSLSLAAAACMLSACAASDDSSEITTDEEASDQIASADAALVRVGGDKFWPDSNFRFCFASDILGTLPPAWEATVRSSLANMRRRLPVTFTEIDCTPTGLPGADPTSYVLFKRDYDDSGANSSETGFAGGVEYIRFFDAPDERTATHEILHALGMYHEQSRSDRENYVNINGSCIDDDKDDNYDEKDDSITSGVYDYKSIMHYQTGLWCDSARPSWCMIPNGRGGTVCATITKKDGTPIEVNSEMSREDINSMFYMYAKQFPTPASGDLAGAAVAIGDFDGDHYSDVAVGLPERTVGGVAGAGEVRVYKGTSRGLYRWQTITQSTAGWGTIAGDNFGTALAAADIDDDGRDELIVGAPYHDVDGLQNAGAVAVLHPDDVGKLQAWRTYTQKTQSADTVRANARFGWTVAAGPIARTFVSGTSGPIDPALTLVVGAPGTDSQRGAVFLYSQTNPAGGSSVRRTQKITGPVASGQFGSALAIGSVTANTTVDLVVGSPYANSNDGQIDVFNGAAAVAASNLSASIVTHFESVTAPDLDTIGFGKSIAIGNFRGSSANDIAVGAPWAKVGNGAVYIYEYENLFADPLLFHRKQTLVQNSTPEAGDDFGATLAVANIIKSTPEHELLVGSPGEDVDAGAISVFKGGATVQALQFLQQSSITGETNQANSQFGRALAAGNINGLGDSGVTSDDFDDVEVNGVADVVVGSPLDDSFSLFWGDTTLGLKGHHKY
ncbi:M12 family metallopeptidase [Sorangium sp. So ce269]